MLLCATGIAKTGGPGEREDIEIEIAGDAGAARPRAIRRSGRGRRLSRLRWNRLLVGAIYTRDLVILQGVVLMVAAGFVIVNFVVDMLYAVLDPRIRHGHA